MSDAKPMRKPKAAAPRPSVGEASSAVGHVQAKSSAGMAMRPLLVSLAVVLLSIGVFALISA